HEVRVHRAEVVDVDAVVGQALFQVVAASAHGLGMPRPQALHFQVVKAEPLYFGERLEVILDPGRIAVARNRVQIGDAKFHAGTSWGASSNARSLGLAMSERLAATMLRTICRH